MDMKYVMFERETAIIFPPTLNHSDVARLQRFAGEPTSAGFVQIFISKEDKKVKAHCFGKSETLKMGSDSVPDSQIVTKLIRL